MAIAGKIMLRPMGDYDPAKIYDILDVVTHKQCLWICRKPNTVGIEPTSGNSDTWMLAISGASDPERITEDQIDSLEPIEAIEVDGTPITNEEIDDIFEG